MIIDSKIQDAMKIKKKKNELVVSLDDKIIKLPGHQDSDAYTIFTEYFETHPSFSDMDRKELNEEFKRRGDILIR